MKIIILLHHISNIRVDIPLWQKNEFKLQFILSIVLFDVIMKLRSIPYEVF